MVTQSHGSKLEADNEANHLSGSRISFGEMPEKPEYHLLKINLSSVLVSVPTSLVPNVHSHTTTRSEHLKTPLTISLGATYHNVW
jgi:hypothetical protein